MSVNEVLLMKVPVWTTDPSVRALLVEDNLINQKVTLIQLEKFGLPADAVNNGLEAVEILKRKPYTLILMDCSMPVMDGFEATRQIRVNEAGSGRHTPIIAMTAFAMPDDRQRCLMAGMDDYLAKPIGIDRLYQVLQEWLDKAVSQKLDTLPDSAGPEEIVNRGKLAEIRNLQTEGDPDLVRELVDTYLNQVPEQLLAVREALSRGDARAIHRIVHSMKAASAALGVAGITVLSQELENLTREGRLNGAEELITAIDNSFQKAAPILKSSI